MDQQLKSKQKFLKESRLEAQQWKTAYEKCQKTVDELERSIHSQIDTALDEQIEELKIQHNKIVSEAEKESAQKLSLESAKFSTRIAQLKARDVKRDKEFRDLDEILKQKIKTVERLEVALGSKKGKVGRKRKRTY